MGITTAQKTRLGIFVIIGMIILAAFIVAPLITKMSYRTKTYYTYFENETLQGLEQGATVKFYGVSVGRVERVSYSAEDITKMRVEMSINEQFPVRTDMHVSTGFIGITGLKYVEIMGGSNEAALLEPGGVIPTRAPFFAKISERVDVLAVQVETLLSHLNAITNPDSLRSVKIALDNIADLTGDAKGIFRGFGRMVPEVMTIIDTVQAAVGEANRVMGDVKSITGTIKAGVEESNIPGIIAQVDTTIISVKALTENLSLMVLQTREDFAITLENLRETAENASQLMRMLSENPSLLIRGDVRERDNR